MAVQDDAFAEKGPEQRPEALTELAYAFHRSQVAGQDTGGSESGRQHCALGAGASSALVTCAMNQWLELRSGTHVERTNPLRRVEFVTGNRKEVDAQLIDASRYLAHG